MSILSTFIDFFLIMLKYVVFTIVVANISNFILSKFNLMTRFILQIIFTISIPILSIILFPTFSYAYLIFLFGFLMKLWFAPSSTTRVMDMSIFERKYGKLISITAMTMMLIGMTIGFYNLISG